MASSSLASSSSLTLISSRVLSRSGGSSPRRQCHIIQSPRCGNVSQAERAKPESPSSSLVDRNLTRRHACLGVSGAAVSAVLGSVLAPDADAMNAKPVEVGSYLPRYAADGSFCVFKASTKDTPALRAGKVKSVAVMRRIVSENVCPRIEFHTRDAS